MKPHGLNANMTYEIIDKNILKSQTINSKLEGWINFENLKTGQKATLPFRSFVSQFLNTIHGILSGDGGADTKLQSVSCTATKADVASNGILVSTDTLAPSITDTSIDSLITSASLYYNAHSFEPPSYNGFISKFAFSRVIANNYSAAFYPEQIGIKTRRCTAAGVPSASSAATNAPRVISKDLNAITIASDESVRVTFTFQAGMDEKEGGIVLNFVKLIYNTLIKGNLNHTSSLLKSRTGTNPTYTIASAAGIASNAASMGDIFVGSSGSGYIGIVLQRYEDEFATPVTPGNYVFDADHTGFTASANTISAIEFTTIANGANFSITRTFTNTSTTTKQIGRIGLLTRGDALNITGATLHSSQILLMDNKPNGSYIEVAPGQILKVTYNFGIQV